MIKSIRKYVQAKKACKGDFLSDDVRSLQNDTQCQASAKE